MEQGGQMNPEWKKKWVAGLRSDNYEQGQKYLRVDDKFCCLGVLCDLVDPSRWVSPSHTVIYFYDGSMLGLPKLVQDVAGVDECGTVDMGPIHSLAEMNDIGFSFGQIADVIEQEL
jgi:hypothetical protein